MSIELMGSARRPKRGPHFEHREEILGGGGQSKRAGVLLRRGLATGSLAEWGLGIDQRNAEAFRRKLRQRESERSPGEATAGNYDLVG